MFKLEFPTFRRIAVMRGSFQSWWPWTTTKNQRRALMRLIAVATEQRLPLAPLLEAWAADERGVQRRRVKRLARLLREGTPLADAAEQVPGALGDDDVLAIRFGAQSGTLAASLRSALASSQAWTASDAPAFSRTILYGCILVFVASLIVTFIQIKIVPVFQAILDDFDMPKPRALEWSVAFADWIARFWLVVLGVAAVLAWSTFSGRLGRFVRNTLGGRLLGPLRELRTADVLQKLSVAMNSGRPVPGALSTLARYHYDPSIRHKLLFVRNELEQGAEAWQSMATAGLLAAPDVKLLRTAERVGNRSWVLERLAMAKKRRTWRQLQRLGELVMPALVVLLGAFVLFQAVSLFVPLVELILGSM